MKRNGELEVQLKEELVFLSKAEGRREEPPREALGSLLPPQTKRFGIVAAYG